MFSSGNRKRHQTIPSVRPSVSSQFGTPGSEPAITTLKLPSGSSVVWVRLSEIWRVV